MANRRMFSKTVTNSSHFLGLPLSAQALYYHIGMNTDDDGYCEKLYVMRLSLCQPSDIQALIDGLFIYQFNDNILLDLFFDENNQIRKDRKKDSNYAKLYPKSTICQPEVNHLSAQVSVVEVRLGKVKEKTIKKENTDGAIASYVIDRFNKITNKKRPVSLNNPTYHSLISINIKELKKTYGIKEDDAIKKDFDFVLDNQKKIADDTENIWSRYELDTLLAKKNYFKYREADQYGGKQSPERNRGREINPGRDAWIANLPPFIDIGTEYLKADKFAELWDKTPKDEREPLREMIHRAKDEEANRGGKISKVDGLMGGMLKGKAV